MQLGIDLEEIKEQASWNLSSEGGTSSSNDDMKMISSDKQINKDYKHFMNPAKRLVLSGY